jgi:hypothetical protein
MSSRFRSERINLRCHHEIITVQTPDFVRPEGHCHLAPFGENRGMMAFSLGERTNTIRKGQSLGKVPEPKNAFQPRNGFALYQRPIRDLRL